MLKLQLETEHYNDIINLFKAQDFQCALKALETLKNYIQKLFVNVTDENKIAIMNRKFDHILDTVDFAIKYNKVDETDELELNIVIAVLHDTGRAEEIYSQSKNDVFLSRVNHPELGTRYLFDEQHIYEFLTSNFMAADIVSKIKPAVMLHGNLSYDKGPYNTEQLRLISNIRCYDKIAIFYQMIRTDATLVYQMPMSEVVKIPISELTKKELLEDKVPINRGAEAMTRMRQCLLTVGCIYDPDNDERFYRYLKETDGINQFINRLTNEEMTEEQRTIIELIKMTANNYVNEKLVVNNIERGLNASL